jgi:acyl-CoA thioester hydrolase
LSDPLAGFPVVLDFPVHWGDQDAFGHVNNIVYLRWCETARVEYLVHAGLWQLHRDEGVGPIVASIAATYERAVAYPDRVRVGARVTRIGNSSFRMDHRVVSEAQGAVAAIVESVLVVFDYRRQKPVPMPPDVREAIGRLEGTPSGAGAPDHSGKSR